MPSRARPASRYPLPLVAGLVLALAGCGGPVARDAPALLGVNEIAARAAVAQDTTGGAQTASALARRAARLRARAAVMRRDGLSLEERAALLRRADLLTRR